MPFTYVKVAVAAGASLNTAFSSIYNGLDARPLYHVAVQNNTSSCVNFCIATSGPTITATDQFFVPASGYAWWDCEKDESLAYGGPSLNLYARVDDTTIVSGVIRVALK